MSLKKVMTIPYRFPDLDEALWAGIVSAQILGKRFEAGLTGPVSDFEILDATPPKLKLKFDSDVR